MAVLSRALPRRTSVVALLATVLTVAGGLVLVPAAQAVPVPVRSVVSVFSDPGYGGKVRDLGPGVYDVSAGQTAPVPTNDASSLVVPSGLEAWLCKSDKTCRSYPAGSYTKLATDDTAVRIVVGYAPGATPDGLPTAGTIFSGTASSGASQALGAGQVVDLWAKPGAVGNDATKSVTVAPGSALVACADNDVAPAELGVCETYGPGATTLSSAVVSRGVTTVMAGQTPSSATTVALYQHYDLAGTAATYGPGVYDLTASGSAMAPKDASSLVVPAGMVAWLCNDKPGTCSWYPAGTYPKLVPNDAAVTVAVARLDVRQLPVGATLYADYAGGGQSVQAASGGQLDLTTSVIGTGASTVDVASGHVAVLCDTKPTTPGGTLGTCTWRGAGRNELTAYNDKTAVAIAGPSSASAGTGTGTATPTTGDAPQPAGPATEDGPGPQVMVHAGGSLDGAMAMLRTGYYDATQGQLGSVGNDALSSMVVPSGLVAWLCTNGTTNVSLGACKPFGPGTYNAAQLGSLDNQASTVVVEAGAGQQGNEGAIAWADPSYGGAIGFFAGYGAYDVDNGGPIAAVGNDKISSLKVREGYVAIACNDGAKTTSTTSCHAFGSGFHPTVPAASNDAISHLAVFPTSSTDPAKVGRWSTVKDVGFAAIHGTLLKSGKVMVWEEGASQLFDPATGTMGSAASPPSGQNLFCSTHTVLPNGDVVAVATGGGGKAVKTGAYYSAETNSWKPLNELNTGRYYPGGTLLGDGSWLIAGGNDVNGVVTGTNNTPITTPELWSNGSWKSLTGAKLQFSNVRGQTNDASFFPWLAQVPSGKVLYAGPDTQMQLVNPSGTGSVSLVGKRDNYVRTYGSFAIYSTGKMLITGGEDSVTSSVVVDFNSDSPTVTPTSPLAIGRRQLNLTILADGTVAATGGNSSGSETIDRDNVVLTPEIWNPATGQWTKGAPMARSRQYHSIGILVPDGRLLTAGEVYTAGRENNLQFYSPPYLFKADGTAATRPTITKAPASVSYGKSFQITTGGAIARAHLIKLGSVTHATNFDQRLVPLTLSGSGTTWTATGPTNPNMAPPGHYMLFAVDAAGVPSVARIVKLG